FCIGRSAPTSSASRRDSSARPTGQAADAGQFATVTPTLAVPVRLVASVMTTEMVWAPFGTAAVFQGIEVGESAQGCCATCVASAFTVQIGVPCAPPGQTITQFVPLTVSPDLGPVMATVSGALLTTMSTLAVPERAVASVMVTERVWAPFGN